MPLVRWTDDRLDDLHATVRGNDHRLDTVQDMAQTLDRRVMDIEKRNATLSASKWQTAMFLASVLSPIATIIVLLVKG